jgi:glycine dehydrogenase subunit 1
VKIVSSIDGVVDIESLKKAVGDNTAAVLLQHPNFYGNLESAEEIGKIAHQAGALFVMSVDPISLGILKTPREYGADIVTAEGQCLGNTQHFGGPYLGVFACVEKLVRKMPGRIVGVTNDKEGRRGFVLTLQTREQQIRREKATSNICTNEGLNMLAATVYMSLMGKSGIKSIAELCLQKSHYLAGKISKIEGFKLNFKQPFFKEFVVETPVSPKRIIKKLLKKNIFAGIDLSALGGENYGLKNSMLVAVTEKRTKEEMDLFIEELKNL